MDFLNNECRARIHLKDSDYFLVYAQKRDDGSYKTIFKEALGRKTFNNLLENNLIENYRGTTNIWIANESVELNQTPIQVFSNSNN